MAKDKDRDKDKKVGDKPKPPEESKHSLFTKAIEGVISERALALGAKIGKSEYAIIVLDWLEKALGHQITNMAITEAAEFVRVPKIVQKAIADRGWSEITLRILNKQIEQIFEGIWAVRQERGVSTGTVTAEDVKLGFARVRAKFQEDLKKEKVKVMTAIKDMPDKTKIRPLLEKIAGIKDPVQRVNLQQYMQAAADDPVLLQELADLPVEQWLPLLETLYPKAAKGAADKVGEIASKAVHMAHDFVVDPKHHHTPQAVRDAEHLARKTAMEAEMLRLRQPGAPIFPPDPNNPGAAPVAMPTLPLDERVKDFAKRNTPFVMLVVALVLVLAVFVLKEESPQPTTPDAPAAAPSVSASASGVNL